MYQGCCSGGALGLHKNGVVDAVPVRNIAKDVVLVLQQTRHIQTCMHNTPSHVNFALLRYCLSGAAGLLTDYVYVYKSQQGPCAISQSDESSSPGMH